MAIWLMDRGGLRSLRREDEVLFGSQYGQSYVLRADQWRTRNAGCLTIISAAHGDWSGGQREHPALRAFRKRQFNASIRNITRDEQK